MNQVTAGLGDQFADLVPGVGPLDGQHRQLRALVQLHVIAVEVGLHPRQILITGRRVDHQAIAVIEAVDDHVVDDAAVLVEHGAVQGAAGAVQAFDVVGQQMLEPGLGLCAADIDHGHVGDIKNPAIAAHLMVLLDLRAVMQRHVPTAKIDHLRAQREVKVIQRRTLSHGFLLPGLARVRAGAARDKDLWIKGFAPLSATGSVRRTAPNAAHCSRKV
ncbi:hypothetical protein D3C73_1090830 [compost metagenome]